MNFDIEKNTTGVYLIRNKINGRVYIGSSKCIKTRVSSHLRQLKQNIHHSIELQLDFNKFGIENFQVEVLLECSISDARKYEEEYINKFNLKQFGYNQGHTSETLEKKQSLFKDRLLCLLKEQGYKGDGKLYWFNIFEISKALNIKVTSLLSNFGINTATEWYGGIRLGNGEYATLNLDNINGIQITAFHESYFELELEDRENVYIDICV